MAQYYRQPPDYEARPQQTGRRKKKRTPVQRFFYQIKRGLVKGLRAAARGVYQAYRAVRRWLMHLPANLRYVVYGGSGLVVVLLVLILSLGGAKRKATVSADMPALSSAFAAEAASGTQEGGASSTYLSDGTPTTDGAENPDGAADGGEGDGGEAAAIAGLTDERDEVVSNAETTETFTGELKKGDDSAIISEIQARLMELGYMDSDEPTEHFGSITQHALERFQAHNELPDDGICGEATYALL